MVGSLPQRSRGQGRPSAAASAGLTLDGGDSEGNLTSYIGKADCERLSLANARAEVFPVVSFRRVTHGRRHSLAMLDWHSLS